MARSIRKWYLTRIIFGWKGLTFHGLQMKYLFSFGFVCLFVFWFILFCQKEFYSFWFQPGCVQGFFGQNCELPCRYPNYGQDCQLECVCTMELCNHISGCPKPATETTTDSKSYGSRSVQGEIKIISQLLENYLAFDKNWAYLLIMFTF